MTHSISLRDVTQDDLPIFFEHQLDPDASKMAAFPSRDKESFRVNWAKIMADEKVIIKTILVDGQAAGHIACFEIFGKREVSYWIGKEFWGKGIASESLKQFLGAALPKEHRDDVRRSKCQVTMRPLYAHVAKHNAASQRVLQKCGFEVIGEDKWTPSPNEGEVEELILELN